VSRGHQRAGEPARTAVRSPDKQGLRERIWALLERRRVARFPLPIAGRIPNFAGAGAAAERAAALPEWRAARTVKCNPDAPQRPLRLRALSEGKVVFMAVPRLTQARCFLRLDPARLGRRLAEAATIRGAGALGEPVGPEALGRIDLIVAGSVAVNGRGDRVGKGGGYSDLEFALAREVGAVDDSTPVITTVHDLQVVDGGIPMRAHDVPLDVVVTPTRVIRAARRRRRPRGIRWGALTDEQVAAMPPLAALRPPAARGDRRHARPGPGQEPSTPAASSRRPSHSSRRRPDGRRARPPLTHGRRPRGR
jgi:5-formyltetrahydrofolate cyclo-ligase